MRKFVSFEIIIQVSMRINMQDVEVGIFFSECFYYGIGNGMISAKT